MAPSASQPTGGSEPLSPGHLLTLIRDGQASSRSDIARITGLARSTVSQRVEALLDLGLIVEEGDSASTGGRPATRLKIRRDGTVVLSADLGASHARLAVTDVAGQVLGEEVTEMPITEGPDKVLTWTAEHFGQLLKQLGRQDDTVLGIGMGVPGPVQFGAGKAVAPPIMPGWDGFAIADYMTGRFGPVPVIVDNDVNIMALGEYWTNWRRTVSDFLFVKVATGIGAGVISGGLLQRGAQGAAGDLGHIQVHENSDDLCSCGNHGCVEAVASGRALAEKLTAAGHPAKGTMDVVALVRAGNADAIRLVRDAGRDLGVVLAQAVNLLNPAVVVVGGDLAKAQEQLFAGIREVVYRRSTALATGHLQIIRTKLGDRAGVVGAAVNVIEDRLSPAAVDQLLAARGVA